MREKKKIKEGGKGLIEIGHWTRMKQNEMKDRKNNIKNKKS